MSRTRRWAREESTGHHLNKTEIKQAVASIFDVSVVSVNTMNRKGKLKRTGYVLGKRKHTKRALVRLADGHKIDIFEV
jgi:large subunit ribosomal protein L23